MHFNEELGIVLPLSVCEWDLLGILAYYSHNSKAAKLIPTLLPLVIEFGSFKIGSLLYGQFNIITMIHLTANP